MVLHIIVKGSNCSSGRHFCKAFTVPKKAKKAAIVKSLLPVVPPEDTDTEKKSKKHLLAQCFYNKHVTPGHAGK